MSNLQQVIARLLSDRPFRSRVRAEGAAALQDYNLTVDEVSAVLRFDLDRWDANLGSSPDEDPVGIGFFR